MWTLAQIIFKNHSDSLEFYGIWPDVQAYMRFVWPCAGFLLENKFYPMLFAAASVLEKSE